MDQLALVTKVLSPKLMDLRWVLLHLLVVEKPLVVAGHVLSDIFLRVLHLVTTGALEAHLISFWDWHPVTLL